MKNNYNFLLWLFAICANVAIAQNSQNLTETNKTTSKPRPDGHAPISVLGDHLHKKGGFRNTKRFCTLTF